MFSAIGIGPEFPVKRELFCLGIVYAQYGNVDHVAGCSGCGDVPGISPILPIHNFIGEVLDE